MKILVLVALLTTGELRTAYYADSLPPVDTRGVAIEQTVDDALRRGVRFSQAAKECARDVVFVRDLEHVLKAWCATVEPLGGPEWEPVEPSQ